MDYYILFQHRIARIIEFLKENGRQRGLVLYPFGKQGMLIKQILNWQYGMEESFIIDDGLSKENKNIKPVSYLKEIDTSKYFFIITSDNLDHWDEIRKNIREYVEEKNIIDMYSYKPLKYDDPRVASLEMAAREIYSKKIGGVCAEAGVYMGNFASYINEFFYNKKLYLFDTFEGFTDQDIQFDREQGYSLEGKGFFGDTSVELVLGKMRNRENVVIRKGYFPDTSVGINEEFCFVSLDMDLYQPIKAGLEYFYPRLLRGGYIFIHDCDIGQGHYKGARTALEEYVEQKHIGYVMLPDHCTAVITK